MLMLLRCSRDGMMRNVLARRGAERISKVKIVIAGEEVREILRLGCG